MDLTRRAGTELTSLSVTATLGGNWGCSPQKKQACYLLGSPAIAALLQLPVAVATSNNGFPGPVEITAVGNPGLLWAG